MAESPPHHCPGCGDELRVNARYPWYFCRTCTSAGTDGSGRTIEFTNTSLSGGIAWRLHGDDEWQPQTKILCRIADRPALVMEAHLGGVVAQPVNDLQARAELGPGVADLR